MSITTACARRTGVATTVLCGMDSVMQNASFAMVHRLVIAVNVCCMPTMMPKGVVDVMSSGVVIVVRSLRGLVTRNVCRNMDVQQSTQLTVICATHTQLGMKTRSASVTQIVQVVIVRYILVFAILCVRDALALLLRIVNSEFRMQGGIVNIHAIVRLTGPG